MAAEGDDLARALREHGHATADYVRVEEQILGGLPPTRRRSATRPLLVVLVLLAVASTSVFVARNRELPASSATAGSAQGGGVAHPPVVWPNAANTGVPLGTALTTYTGPCTITAPDTVIDSKTVNCFDFTIRAANVSVTKSVINGIVTLDTDRVGATDWSLSLVDSEVNGGSRQLAALGLGNLTVLRSNIHGGQTAIQCEASGPSSGGDLSPYCDIRDSYLHGQAPPVDAQWHMGGFLSEGGDLTIVMDHNYVACDGPVYPPDGGCTGDINLLPHFGIPSHVTVNNNKLFGGPDLAYCTFAGASTADYGPQAHDIVYTNNVFERGSTGICGAFGPVTDCREDFPGNVWSNNRYEDGALVACF